MIKLENISHYYNLENKVNLSLKKKIIKNLLGGKIIWDNENASVCALKNINLSLKKGDRVGLIGLNGSGKSTLLKIIAKIYAPTDGELITQGKILAVLNGSSGIEGGFSGIENIYRLCFLYGLTKKQINQKIDEIISFSELQDFIELPVDAYSDGMKARLVFSIITSLDHDILLMDEIIGVNDAKFLNKSNTRINNFINKSKILIISTHSIEVIKKFCNKAILLDQGNLKEFGNIETVIKNFHLKNL